MSAWLMNTVAIVYLIVGIEQWYKGNVGMSIAFVSYAFANVGLSMAAS